MKLQAKDRDSGLIGFEFYLWIGFQLRTRKDRIVNALLILLFLAIMGGAAYFIFKTMTHWNIKGLG